MFSIPLIDMVQLYEFAITKLILCPDISTPT